MPRKKIARTSETIRANEKDEVSYLSQEESNLALFYLKQALFADNCLKRDYGALEKLCDKLTNMYND